MIHLYKPLACSLFLFALASGCSSESSPKLLDGDKDSPASAAYSDYSANDFTMPDEISEDAEGNAYDRTNLSIAFTPDATVGQVNTLLRSIDGSIVSMLPDVYILLVKIPDPGDLETLDTLAQQILAEPIVRRVTKASMGGLEELPQNYDAATTDLSRIDHNLAILAPAAWNARSALARPGAKPPLVLVTDTFGAGVPAGPFNIRVVNPTRVALNNPSATANGHGYHVLGIISALHTPSASQVSNDDLVTGMYPGALEVAVGDLQKFNLPALNDWMVRVLVDAMLNGQRLVINTSLSTTCTPLPFPGGLDDVFCHEELAKEWLEKLRSSPFYFLGQPQPLRESNLVHLTAAGNFAGPVDTYRADLVSGYASASLLPNLVNSLGLPVPKSTSTMVVENRENGPAPLFGAGCEFSSSKLGGHISGIGHRVWSFTSPLGLAKNKTGTSMATPQVSGLAAYIWALNPTLLSDQVIAIIADTSVFSENETQCTNRPAPVVDAYAAVLAVDSPLLFESPATQSGALAPVRTAILDVADANGVFDEHDVEMYAAAFLGEGSTERDFSRLDLNGDGFTGGTGTARFNLDIDAMHNYEIVTLPAFDIEFDESALTDTEILCYYAFTPLFQGDGDKRDEALGEACESQAIYYLRSDPNVGLSSIFRMDAGGSNQVELLAGASIDSRLPILSPDGSKLALSGSLSGLSDIHTMNTDGSELVNLTNNSTTRDVAPSWSPDSTQIAFFRNTSVPPSIHIMNADGSNLHELVASGGKPQWSPDGQTILFGRRSGTTGNFVYTLHTIKPNGTGEALIATGQDTFVDYAWSPDGSQILYLESTQLVVTDANGGNPLVVATGVPGLQSLSWSPDGSQIAYENPDSDGEDDIFVMDADGGNKVNVTNSVGADFMPNWGPAGLLFLSFRDGNVEIYKTNLAGEQTNLSNSVDWENFAIF